jgi:hypothetical protein
MNDQPQTKNRQRWAALGGVALGAFALWLGPVAAAMFLLALAVMTVRLLILRSRLRSSVERTASTADVGDGADTPVL